MAYPYDKWPRQAPPSHVPIHVAKQLAEQRDRLATQVRELRRKNDELTEARRGLEAQNQTLAARAGQAEKLAADLRGELEARSATSEEVEQETGTDSDDAAEALERLSRRVEELLGDLERVRKKAAVASAKAARQEKLRLLGGMADVLDSIERGLEIDADGAWRQGLEAIHRQMISFLRAEGVQLVGEPGEALDPRVHEATGVVESTAVAPGRVAQVQRRGLQLDDGTVIRPAQVTIARREGS
jgi:molecular chaperone GrpE